MKLWEDIRGVPEPERLIAVLWLSFLSAGIATTIFFALVDPIEIGTCLGFDDTSRMAAYTLGFFLFWLLTAASSLLTTYFLTPSALKPATASSKRNADA